MMSFVHAPRVSPGLAGADASHVQTRTAWAESLHAELVRRLASDFAHETLQPLAAVSNYVSAWRITLGNSANEPLDRATQLVWLGELQQATDRAIDSVRRFRDFATLGYWHRDEPWELSGWLRQSMQLVKMTHRSSGIELEWDLSPDSQEVQGSTHELPRVLVAVLYHLLHYPALESRSRRLVIRTWPVSSATFLTLCLESGRTERDEWPSVFQAAASDWDAKMREIVEYAEFLGVTLDWHSTAACVELAFQWRGRQSDQRNGKVCE